MIRKLQIKFIAMSMAALLVLLFVIVVGMNLINYEAVIAEADDILVFLSEHSGVFPDPDQEGKNLLPKHMSPETPYESRYFSVLIGEYGEVILTDTGKIKAVSSQQASDYALQIMTGHRDKGFVDNYRFICSAEQNVIRITFLDCGRRLEAFQTFLFASIGMGVAGYLLFFFVILFFSGKMMRPVAESYEKQKRFITDAGHEIKTPLAIIKADVDVLEMELEDNEWLQDIQKQTKRLATLTNDLVYLARMEEAKATTRMIEFPLSDVVSETAASFHALAQTQGKTFECCVQPMLSLTGDEKAITQLVSILLDNALKYSPENGIVSLNLSKQNKSIQLSVQNTTMNPISKESLSMLFERFYRVDSSHNSQTGGHGIGLSIAKAIVSAHNGKIQAKAEADNSLQITITFSA